MTLTRLAMCGLLALVSCRAAGPSLLFEQNQGQSDPSVRFLARARGAALFFQDDAIVASLHGGSVTWTFPGSLSPSRWEGGQESPLRIDSFTGGPSRWRRDIRSFERLNRKGIYPGIDAVAYAHGRDVEFDFIVHPGGDPHRLRIGIEGGSFEIDESGDLAVKTAAGKLVHRRPVSYQYDAAGKRREVASRFRLANSREALIETGTYDQSRELVIDPVVTAISYFGGESDEDALGVAGWYLCGATASAELPSSGTPARGLDVFLYPGVLAGRRVIYYGGSGDDRPTVFAATSTFALIGGETTSRDLPTGVSEGFGTRLYPKEGLRAEFRGPGPDSFLTLIPLRGSSTELAMVSTYWGEPGERLTAAAGEEAFRPVSRLAVAVEKTDETKRESNAAVLLLDEFLRPLVRRDWGGSGNNRVTQLQFAPGSLFGAGNTTSPDLIPGSPLRGASDAFAARWDWSQLNLEQAKLLGGAGEENVRVLAVDGGAIWIAGSTSSQDLATVRAWQPAYGGGETDGFAVQLDLKLSTVRRLSYFGGSGSDEITAFLGQSLILPSGIPEATTPLMAGTTSSSDLPVSAGADQARFGGGRSDGFYFRASEEGRPDIASYLGGAGDERVAGGARLLLSRPVSIAGTTTGELGTNLAPERSYRGGREIFLAGLDLPSPWLGPQIVGNGLVTPFYPAPGETGIAVTKITVRSADPSRLRLTTFEQSQPSAMVSTRSAGGFVTLWGLADSGSTELIVTRAGHPERRVPVRLVPAGMALGSDVLIYLANPRVQLEARPAAIDPDTKVPLRFQALPPGQQLPQVRLESSDETLLSVLDAGIVRGLRTGSGELRVVQPAGFLEPEPTPFKVIDSQIRFACPAFGKDLRTGMRLVFDGPPPARAVLEVDPGGPVLLAPSQTGPTGTRLTGAPAGATIWFETVADSGTATIRATGEGLEPAEFMCPVYPSGAGFSVQNSVVRGLVGAEATVSATLSVLAPGGARRNTQVNYLRPDAQPIQLRLDGPVNAAPVTLNPGSTGAGITYRPHTAGKSQLSLIADGFPIDPEFGAITLDVRPTSPLQITTSAVGQYMESGVTLRAVGKGDIRVNLTAAPGRFLLRYPPGAPPSAEVTLVVSESNSVSIGLLALGETGPADLAVRWESGTDRGDSPETIQIVPTMAGLQEENLTDLTLHAWAPARIVAVTGYVDVDGRPVPQSPAPGFFERVRLVSSRPELADISLALREPNSSSDRPDGFALTPRQAGLAELTLESDLPLLHGAHRMRLRVTAPLVEVSRVTVGAFLSAPASVIAPGVAGAREGRPVRVRLTSVAPSQLLLSVLPQTPGAASIEVTIGPGETEARFYAHGIAAGTTEITAEPEGGALTKHPALVVPTGAGFFQVPQPLETDLGATNGLTIRLFPLDPGTLKPLPIDFVQSQFLRTGIGPLRIEAISDPAGGVTFSPEVVLDSGAITGTLRYSATAAGTATIVLTQPPGFTTPSSGEDRASVRVRGPSFSIAETPLAGRDTLTAIRINSSVVIPSPLTITSQNPGKLLVSARGSEAGANQITVQAQGSSVDIFLHGLGGDGTAQASVTGEGFVPLAIEVQMLPTGLEFSDSAPRLEVGQSARLTVRPFLILPSGGVRPIRERPGANVRIGLRTEPAGIVDAPAEVVSGAPFEIRGRAEGTALITLVNPAGFAAPPRTSTVTVSTPAFSLPASPIRLGKDLMTSVDVGTGSPNATLITLTSSNPASLLLSRDVDTPASAVVTVEARPAARVILHGLAASGTAQVTALSPGYANGRFQVDLTPSGFVLQGDLSRREVSVGAVVRLTPVPYALDPVSLEPRFQAQALRPGKVVSVSLQASDSGLVRISPARIDLPVRAPAPPPAFEITTLSPGRVTTSLRTPEGFQTPPQAQSLTLDITDAFFSFVPPRVGYNLQTAASLQLTPAPLSAVVVTVRSLNPDLMRVSAAAGVEGEREVGLRVSGGNEAGFYLHGLAGSGSARLAVSAPGYRSFELDIPLLPSGFVFESVSTTLPAASQWRIPILLAPLSALTRLPLLPASASGAYALRPGAGPLTLEFEIADSGPGLRFAPLVWNGGQASLVPVAAWDRPGGTTVSIVQPQGFSEASANRSISVSVQ